MKLLIMGFSLLLSANLAYSQKAPAKFGDIAIDDLKMTTYDKDTAAAAVVLVDFGQSSLEYHKENGFYLAFERLRRIKILKKSGFDWGDFEIPLYKSGTTDEKLTQLKAVTYNLENGKIVETKMKNDAVFREAVDKNRENAKFTLPNVKEGSIIEISYRVHSEFIWNFQDWRFQSSIPVVWSEYRATFPEYFSYDKYTQGYAPFFINEFKTEPATITLNHKERIVTRVTRIEYSQETINFQEQRYRWVMKDVPAFKEEPFLNTPEDYISKINFELAYTKYPDEPVKNYTSTWADINKLYWESEDFGKEVITNGWVKKIAEEVIAGKTTPEEKISAVHTFVKNNVAWNGRYRKSTYTALRKVLEDKKGSSSEINLLLASMLEKIGLSVSPVLISTRDHGFLREEIAVSSQFNYCIVLVKFNDKQILLDATEPLLPLNILPERCLNGKGMVVTPDAPQWVNLTSSLKSKSTTNFSLQLAADGTLSGNVDIEKTGYDALSARKKFISKGEETYLNDFLKSREWEVSKSSFDGSQEIDKTFKESHQLQIQNHVTASGGVMYINPFLMTQVGSNPFTLEKREYPVDFGFPRDQIYMMQLTIPDGYAVEELPKSRVFALQGNGSRYLYNMTLNGNKILLTCNLSINKSLFVMDEYPNLREFYTQVAAAQAEQIVLKKKI